jgi:hypothetical protein
MKTKIIILTCLLSLVYLSAFSQTKTTRLEYVPFFENINHPQIAYWFFSKDMLNEKQYKNKIDSLAKNSKFTLIFITARNGVNFHDIKTMHPILKDMVAYANQRGLKIGLQLWDNKAPVAIENTERSIQEGEVLLNESGSGTYSTKAKHVRDMKSLIKSELFKVYVFKNTGIGFYDDATLKDITQTCKAQEGKETVTLTINAGKQFEGYTAYILTQHYYNFSSNHSDDALNRIVETLKAYSDIPFSAVGLDEFTNLRVATTWELKNNDVFRNRAYSLSMAKKFKAVTGMDLDRTLFDMRYAPSGNPTIRMKAINAYMDIMRSGTMNVERAFYKAGKELYGKDTFIGLHDTHHNTLDGDEVWQTGLNWWNVTRDYGHSDEHSPTATQMGIGMSYPMNVMYNMYYNKSLNDIVTKALNDLRFGIRTHYHAINDVQGWGVSVEKPESLEKINEVENAARLLNRFNPSFPQIKLLVVFGMEAQVNWFPDSTQRSATDINNKLFIEDKATQLWNAGYRNALMPTDLINDGRLTLGSNGKPMIQGHTYEAIVFLYPQYSKETTLSFLESYLSKGGKLMIEGKVTNDFNGNDIIARWKKIEDKATVKSFSIEAISKLGIAKNALPDGALNEDGSYTFTDFESLFFNKTVTFSFSKNGIAFSGDYKGLAAIKVDEKGNLQKFAATGFSSLKKGGATIFSLSNPADVFIEVKGGIINITIANETKSIKPVINKL